MKRDKKFKENRRRVMLLGKKRGSRRAKELNIGEERFLLDQNLASLHKGMASAWNLDRTYSTSIKDVKIDYNFGDSEGV